MFFPIPEVFGYADEIWVIGMALVGFFGGWIAGGVLRG